MKCLKCGRENQPESRFCVNCGAKIEAGLLKQKQRSTKLSPVQIVAICATIFGIIIIGIALIILFSQQPSSNNSRIETEYDYESVVEEKDDFDELLGTWSCDEETSKATIKHITFYSDSTCGVSGYYGRTEFGTWSLTDGKLFVKGDMGGAFFYYESFSCEYAVDDTELTIYYSDTKTLHFYREY